MLWRSRLFKVRRFFFVIAVWTLLTLHTTS